MRKVWGPVGKKLCTLLIMVGLACMAPAQAAAEKRPDAPKTSKESDVDGLKTKALPPNTWVAASIDFNAALPKEHKDARWATGDGYSDNLYRTKTGTVIIRTGIRSQSAGWYPGYYTNTSVEWDLKANTARVIDIFKWGGGSGGNGKLLAGFKESPTPSPRHTYDGICYVPTQDAMYCMFGANWKCGHQKATEEAKKQLALDNQSTWKFSFETGTWTRIDHNILKLFKRRISPYENHLQHWPQGKRLLYLDSGAKYYAEFNLETNQWEKGDLKNKCPMSLYHARSTWDTKRGLWVFRKGPQACTFNPASKEFQALPNCFEMSSDKKDKFNGWKGVCYIDKHDVYLVTGKTGNETKVYSPEKKKWTTLQGGDLPLINGYCQYDPQTDVVAMNYQLQCFTFRYVPETAIAEAP